MRIEITGVFNLDKIMKSGQCFRVSRSEDDTYRFITGKNILYIKRCAPLNNVCNSSPVSSASSFYEVSCSSSVWNSIWVPYFDLNRDYDSISGRIPKSDKFSKKCEEYSRGIRILQQDYFEMLISFIISQRKSIPAISKSIELICERFGSPIITEKRTIYSFPRPIDLAKATIEELDECKLGYRSAYVKKAAEDVASGKMDMSAMTQLSDEDLFETLKSFYGVGDKVANCVALFAYSRTSLAPIDTWIKKVIETEYAGKNPFPAYGDIAGIIQQYIFYYAQMHKSEFD